MLFLLPGQSILLELWKLIHLISGLDNALYLRYNEENTGAVQDLAIIKRLDDNGTMGECVLATSHILAVPEPFSHPKTGVKKEAWASTYLRICAHRHCCQIWCFASMSKALLNLCRFFFSSLTSRQRLYFLKYARIDAHTNANHLRLARCLHHAVGQPRKTGRAFR